LVGLVYENKEIEGLSSEEVRAYIRYLANRRLLQLGLKPIFEQEVNPLPWLDWIVSGDRLKNFFEGRVTDYSAQGMSGGFDWSSFDEVQEDA